MLQKLRELGGEFESLPLGMRVLAGAVGAGAVVGLAKLYYSWGQAFALVGILVAIVLLLWLINVLVRIWSRRKGQGISEALSQRMSEAPSGSEESGAEDSSYARKLLSRWKDVDTRLRERGFDFYSLPWYLVIGASQSGKTTAIQKSDQEFPIGDEPVVEYGGTRNCQWHFTNKAILIDTAGRYLEHYSARESGERVEEDRQEWERFLSLLLRYRSRSPINGLIVAIKVPDILAADPEERIRTAKMIRTALHDVEEQLKVQCPVYILVTMCDRILGFADFFGMLPGLSDRSLFGWSRPGPFDRPFSADELEPGFASLRERLGELRLDFLRERNQTGADDPESRRKLDTLYAFPDEFARTLEPLREMLASIFAPAAFSEQHFVRGVYFTSGLQMGPPLVQACLDLLGKGDAGLVETEEQGSKAFFIADFFEDKVFKEAGLVRVTKRWNVERQRRERLARIAAGLIGAAATVWVTMEAWEIPGVSKAPRAALANAVRAQAGDLNRELLPALAGLGSARQTLEQAGQDYFLAGSNVQRAAEELGDAGLRLYADRVFRPIVKEFLDPAGSLHLETWEQCEAQATVLLRLHELASGKTPAAFTESGAVSALVEDLGGLLGARSGIDFRAAVRVAEGPWSEEGVGFLARAAQDHDDALLRTILTRVLGEKGQGASSGFWLRWLTALEEDATDEVLARQPIRELEYAWAWDRLVALDSQIGKRLGELFKLAQGPGQQDLDEKARQGWQRSYGALNGLREQLREHLSVVGGWEDITRDAALDRRRAVFDDLARRLDGAGNGLGESLGHLRHLLEQRRGAVEGWTLRDSVAMTPSEKSSEETKEIRLPDLRYDESRPWHELHAWHRIIGDRSKLLDSLDPRKPGFWNEFAKAGACKNRLEEWMPKAQTGAGSELRRLLDALRKRAPGIRAGLELAMRKRIEFVAKEIQQHLSTNGAREATSNGDESHSPLAGLRGNTGRNEWSFEAARSLALLVQNVSRASEGRGLHEALMQLAEAYFKNGFRTHWEAMIVERKRDRGLPGPEDPGDATDYPAWDRVAGGSHFDRQSVELLLELAREAGEEGRGSGSWADIEDRRLHRKVKDWSRSVCKLWKLYAQEENGEESGRRKELQEMGLGLVAAGKALFSIERPLTRERAVELLRLAQAHRAALLAPELEQRSSRQAGIRDPFVGALAEDAASIRSALGRVAGALFEELWTELGKLADKARIAEKFPFSDGPEHFASWHETRVLLGSEVFAELLGCIWLELPEAGRTNESQPPLFDMTIPDRQKRLGCLAKLAKLRAWFGLGAEQQKKGTVLVRLESADVSRGLPAYWTARVGTRSRRFPIGTIDLPLEFRVHQHTDSFALESDPIEGRKSQRCTSIHPFECLDVQGQGHLDFLAIYYLNESEDQGERGRRIRFRFPRDLREQKQLADAEGKLETLRSFANWLDLWVTTDPPLPSALPDLEAAGLKGR